MRRQDPDSCHPDWQLPDPAPDWQLPAADWQLPVRNWQLPAPVWQLPTAEWQLPSPDWRLPAPDRRGKQHLRRSGPYAYAVSFQVAAFSEAFAPTAVSYAAVLKAMVRAGQVERAQTFLESVEAG
ncbi:unnamed protein product, partial [Effrenium voratum]